MTADEHSGGSKDSDLATICVALIERKEESQTACRITAQLYHLSHVKGHIIKFFSHLALKVGENHSHISTTGNSRQHNF